MLSCLAVIYSCAMLVKVNSRRSLLHQNSKAITGAAKKRSRRSEGDYGHRDKIRTYNEPEIVSGRPT
jgi:hypothetical protein